MRSYGAARSYFSILEFLSWCIIVLGGLVAIGSIMALGSMSRNFGGSPMAGLAGLIPGASVMFAGFMGLVLSQIGRAGVDSAEYGQQSLKIAREQLEISKQGLKQGSMLEQGYAALQAAKDELRNGDAPAAASYANAKPDAAAAKAETASYEPGDTIEYRTKTIRVVEGGYVFGGTIFDTLEKAKARVNEDGFALPAEPEKPKPHADQLGVNEGPKLGGVTRS